MESSEPIKKEKRRDQRGFLIGFKNESHNVTWRLRAQGEEESARDRQRVKQKVKVLSI